MFRFRPKDRSYADAHFETVKEGEIPFAMLTSAFEYKFLPGDVVNDNMEIVESPWRSAGQIPGVLVTSGKTYGRVKNRLLYRCIPDNKLLPAFLVPYDLKIDSFSKVKKNRYILFKVHEWIGKHPEARIVNTLGCVDDFDSFCAYKLHCCGVHVPIQKFTKSVMQKTLRYSGNEDELITSLGKPIKGLQNRTDMETITIDPKGSTDFDDAIGFTELADGSSIISVYISNVTVWLDALEFWDDFTGRVSSLYLPDAKRSMLPPILSNSLCSLMAGRERYVISMDITIDDAGEVKDIGFASCLIRVKRNYVYDIDLEREETYLGILATTRKMRTTRPYLESIDDSHDVIAYLMIMMNHECANILASKETGIFRNVKSRVVSLDVDLPPRVRNFVTQWRTTKGSYASFEDATGHDLIGEGVERYVQITSPIRRLVDLLNISFLQQKLDMFHFKAGTLCFLDKWTNEIPYINEFMRGVKRAQSDCLLLKESTSLRKGQNLAGYVVEIDESEGPDAKWYAVHIPDIGLTTRIRLPEFAGEEMQLYQKRDFSIYIMEDEHSLRRKIRLEPVPIQTCSQ